MSSLTVVINKDGMQEVLIEIEDGKVISGSIRKSDTEFEPLEIADQYELCGCPVVALSRISG